MSMSMASTEKPSLTIEKTGGDRKTSLSAERPRWSKIYDNRIENCVWVCFCFCFCFPLKLKNQVHQVLSWPINFVYQTLGQ